MKAKQWLMGVLILLVILMGRASADLVAHWTFDEGTGDTVTDGIGSVAGQVINATWTDGLFANSKKALAFNGTNAYVNVAGQDWGTFNQVSIALWLQFNSLPGPYNAIFHEDWTAGGIHFMVRNSGVVGFSLNGRGPNDYNSQAVLEAGEIYHVIATFDITTGLTQIYINGVLDSEGTSAPSASAIFLRSPFTIGSWNTDRYWDGVLDDLRIYDHIVTQEEIPDIMAGVPAELASEGSPEDGQTDVPREVTLAWRAGEFAQTHTVYFGTTFEAVDQAGPEDAVSPGQAATSYEAGVLDFSRTYYWRVDEVNGTPDKTVFKGTVWSFTVEPYAIPIAGDSITVTASSSTPMNPPDLTVDGSGLTDNVHSTNSDQMWLSAAVDLTPWLMYEFDEIQKLDQMLIWNSNSKSEGFIGWGIKDVIIEVSVNGADWTALAETSQISRAPGLPTYSEPQVIDFDSVPAQYVRINILSNWGGILTQYGVSEVRFYGLPVYPRSPDPASGSMDVLPNSAITWRAGREASEHTVYVSADPNALAEGTAPSVSSATNGVDLSSLALQMGETYYWQVDEVNQAEAPAVWTGPVWSFSTPEALIVDDFEGYGNRSPDRPFQTWLDGFGYSADEFFPVTYPGNGTGAGIGHDIWSPGSPHFDGTIMETTITLPGSTQSMPFYYTNTGEAASETQRTFAAPQDWSVNGIRALSLNVYGQPGNTGQMYLKINNTKVLYDGSLTKPQWQTWNINLSDVGVTLNHVTGIAIGVDGAGAAGLVYVDDIRLHPRRCIPELGPAGDINGDCLVDDKDLAALMEDWLVHYTAVDYTFDSGLEDTSGHANHGIARNNPVVTGGVLSLNGSSFVDVPLGGDNPFDGSQDFSISMDFKTAASTILFSSSRDNTPANHAMALYVNNDGAVVYDNFYVAAAVAAGTVLDDNWHTAVVTFDAEGPFTRVYLDGVLGGTAGFNPAVPDIASDTVRIGGSLNETFPYSIVTGDMVGSVDNVRVFTFTLTPNQVSGLPSLPAGPADLNGSGIVDQADKDILEAAMGTEQLWPM
ncbi:MAG: discoidin domain-containing protein [Phycisphaerae bacterium]|nr:discoidin domain-containing protein [Phycisphaerae bacterium]